MEFSNGFSIAWQREELLEYVTVAKAACLAYWCDETRVA